MAVTTMADQRHTRYPSSARHPSGQASEEDEHDEHDEPTTLARCAACRSTVGYFANRWRLSDLFPTYVCPVQLASYRLVGVARARGKAQQALSYDRDFAGTGIEHCQIRDVRCSACRISLGFACVDAPNSSRQYRDIEFFHRKNLQFIDDRTGRAVDPLIIQDIPPITAVPADARVPAARDARNIISTNPRVPSMSRPREIRFHDTTAAPASHPHPRDRDVSNSAVMSRPGMDVPRPRSPAETWAGAISRLQTQVIYNTSMHESHRRQVGDLEQAVGQLQQEMSNVINVLGEFRAELRARSSNNEMTRADPGDLDLLVGQLASVTTKTNEIDGLKMQVELLKNRMKRLEEHGSPALPHMRPRTESTQREPYESSQHPPSHHPPPPLPHMRSGGPIPPSASPRDDRSAAFAPSQPGLISQPSAVIRPPEPRSHPADALPPTAPSVLAPGFRPADPLPPPNAISGWRPAEGFPPPGSTPAPLPPVAARPHAMEPEAQPSGWASVNAGPPPKRPFEESRPAQYEPPSLPGSPKRTKLAPIMPRSSYPEDGFPHVGPGYNHGPHPEGQYPPSAGRTVSDDSVPGAQSFRFVTSTGEGQDAWRGDVDRAGHAQDHLGPGRGRGRGRGSRAGRGRGRGRGGNIIMHHQSHEGPEHASHEWSAAQQSPSNGFYHPVHPHSPSAGVMRRVSDMPGEVAMSEFSARPIHHSDIFAVQDPGSGKKSRQKPIRNSDGILIRKDGRPDMRSVSSANNLRKVHAKKELERLEMEGRPPSWSRSIAPAHSNSQSEDGDGSRSGTPLSMSAHEGHPDDDDDEEAETPITNGMTPHRHYDHAVGPDNMEQLAHSTEAQSLADRFFPRPKPAAEEDHNAQHDVVMRGEDDTVEVRMPERNKREDSTNGVHHNDVSMDDIPASSDTIHAAHTNGADGPGNPAPLIDREPAGEAAVEKMPVPVRAEGDTAVQA